MRVIVHVVEAFGGGVFASVTQTCNMLVKQGLDVHLIYSEREETPSPLSDFIDSKISLHHISMARNIHPIKDFSAFLALVRFFRTTRVDVIHLHSSKAGVLGRAAAYVCGLKEKVFYSPRGLSFLQQDASRVKRAIYRWLEWFSCRMSGVVVACSKGEFDEVARWLKPRALVLIENAVDINMVTPKSQKSTQVIRVGTIGRIAPARNPVAFLGLARDFCNSGIEFIWVGGGDQTIAEQLGNVGVTVTGWLARKDALRQLSDFDIYVQTSLWEGMPIAVIESMVAGVPAVVTDVIGNRDVVDHGETGFIASNTDEFKMYLERLIKEPSLREKMGIEARKRAIKRFSLERMMNDLVKVYAREKV
jgi:glycosyltransferase involved in cell wall biosynthesis